MRGWIIAVTALALAGCEAPRDMVPVAIAAVTHFHGQLDAGQGREIVSAAEPGKPVSSDRLAQMLNVVRIRLGKVVASKQVSLKDEYKADGRMISMTYRTEFADGSATEDFVYHITGGKAVLYGYTITATDKLVDDFHAKLDAGQFDAIDGIAGPEIKSSGRNFIAILDGVHRRMGAVKSTRCTSFNARVVNGVRTLELKYETVFEAGTESEEFVFRTKADGTVELGGYFIEPVKSK